jgi:carboxyl-terminal processing protease
VRARVGFLVVSLVLVAVLVSFASGASELVGKGLVRLVGMFGQVVALVRTNYVEDVPVDRLEVGAMTGLVEAADPGGSWVPDSGEAAFAEVRGRDVPAYGLVLGKRASYPVVLEVLPASAAEKAGLRAGEMIERIGDEPVRARPLWRTRVILDEAAKRGGTVTLDVIDRQFEGERRVQLAAVETPASAPRVVEDEGVPVVRVPVLGHQATSQLETALAALGSHPAIVVDARGLALGDYAAVPALAAVLAGGDVSLTIGRKDGQADTLRGSGPQRAWRVVVCIDPTTAGPGEALALALKGRGATLVGLDSYGDTGQRKAIPTRGGHLWLADRWCVGADGKALLGEGIKPDDVVRLRRGADAILQRALEIARGGTARKAA